MSVEFDFSTIPQELLQKWSDEVQYMKNLTILRSNDGYFPTPERFSDANSVAATVFMNFLDTNDFMKAFVDYMKYQDKIKKKITYEQLMKKKKYQTILKACNIFEEYKDIFEGINENANRVSYYMHRNMCGPTKVPEDELRIEFNDKSATDSTVKLLRDNFDSFFKEFSEIEQQLGTEYGLRLSDNMKINFTDFPDFVKWLSYKDWC